MNEIATVTTETEEPTISIRRLKVKDLKRLTELFEKGVREIGEESLTKLISSTASASSNGSDNSTTEETIGETVVTIGTTVLTKMVRYCNDDLAEFFADLLGKTIEEYEDMDMDTPIKVIDQIRKAPEVEGFFMMSSLVSKATALLEKPFGKIKERFDSILEESKTDS